MLLNALLDGSQDARHSRRLGSLERAACQAGGLADYD
jgi:hypothetical protein